jgi:DNA repair exonuclease SbcCD ATPase subunit
LHFQVATTRYNEILSGKPKLLEQLESAKKLVEDCKSQLKVREMSMLTINDNKLQLSKLDNEIANIKTYLQQAEDNKITQQELDKLHALENDLNATLFDLNGEIATLQQTLTHSQTQTQTLTQQLQDLRKWNLVELICNQYRIAISKKGLVSVVFSQIANALNAELNDLLSQCNYRIFFDITDDNTLKMIDLVGSRTIRSIKQTSGMQGTFGALGIIDLILKKRLNCIGNILMIDEISGKLSDGKVDMTGKDVNNLNYRDIFAQFLKTLSKDRKVLVVDHILDPDMYDDNIYVNLQLNGTSKLVHDNE